MKQKYRLCQIRIQTKFFFILVLSLMVSILTVIIWIHFFQQSQRQSKANAENFAVTSAQQHIEMGIENTVAVAKIIYTNESLYDFLNTDYVSSAAYYASYYKLMQNSPLKSADVSFINKAMIYTENATITSGSEFRSVRSVQSERWYQSFQKFGKSVMLYSDPETGEFSLIRKLDYETMETGESILKLDMNDGVVLELMKQIPFDGILYIVSNGAVIYSSQPLEDEDDLGITPDFDTLTKNYYTAEVEYYALANYQTIGGLIAEKWYLMLIPILVFLGTILTGIIFSRDIQNRVKLVLDTNQKEGTLSELTPQGNDEIAELTAVGISLSEKLALKTGQYQRSQTAFQQKNADYRELFGKSLYLDALLQISRNFPDLSTSPENEMHALQKEIQLLQKYYPEISVPENLPENWEIPVYSLLLIARQLDEHQGNISIFSEHDILSMKIFCHPTQKQLLKLQAIFEDGEIFTDYDFSPDNVCNPFLRLKHSLGNFVTLYPEIGCITIQIRNRD